MENRQVSDVFLAQIVEGAAEASAATELERIARLPWRAPVDCERGPGGLYTPEAEALADVMTARFARPSTSPCNCRERFGDCITRLNPAQAWALREMGRVGGLLGYISAGGGKSVLGILSALSLPDCHRVVLLAEPTQRIHYRRWYDRLAAHFRVPGMRFSSTPGDFLFVEGEPLVTFVAYSELSSPKATELLEMLDPDTIVADECHRIAAAASSRTKRFLRYLAARSASDKGPARFAGWSGTLIKKSVKDAAHLSAHALGEGSPMPLDPSEVEAWSAVMDPGPRPDTTSALAREMRAALGGPGIERLRAGFQSRLLATPGVVSAKSASVGASLYLHERKVGAIPAAVDFYLKQVREAWTRPDGEELVEVTEKLACARQIASGFYYHWIFRDNDPVELIERWFANRKAWNRELRGKLLGAEAHLDSPMLCAHAAERHYVVPPYTGHLPTWRALTWPDWRDVKDLVWHDTKTAWIDDYLTRDAATWATENRGIVWYLSSAFGRKVAELAGLPYHGGGPDAEAKILAEDGSRSVIASIKAHGTGRDGLQRIFSKQLIAEVPSSGDIWQQLLARLWRPGQEADAVETWVYLHVEENREAMRKARDYARFVAESTGQRQSLLDADMSFFL